VKRWVESAFGKHSEILLEYFEIVEEKALRPVLEWDEKGHHVGCIAVLMGEVRLIDNVIFD
jgi:pantoate--beta-alanine ligase